MTTDLVPSINPRAVLERRDRVLEAARTAIQAMTDAEDTAPYLWATLAELMQSSRHQNRETRMEWIMERLSKEADTFGWQNLMSASGLRTFMDRDARAEWDKAIKNDDCPPLNEANIQATFRSIYDERGAMLERGVIQVFRRLSWDYKNNLPYLFGKKIVVQRFLNYYGNMSEDAGGLDDLVRALCVYDGKPEPDHRNSLARLVSRRGHDRSELSTDYLDIKWFKNRNAHVVFKRDDLVDKLNQLLTKHFPGALPAPR